ncbi:exodeoxyribonuclease III [Cupriavidus agavae]|uniref:Exodeoxyribonuclease III n=1 Tax=Cupriavidus agavae TaxID=1001822 RepID=A0A4Q7S033_9BURK|nr:exodeoxyribonuclease III [Cupriavidus agavae]RZT39496.1 exodeoxyribonuclease III [Cupriavidus agavae]
MPSLKIATFNINGVRTRLASLLAWLEREQPDVACLQELKAVDEGFPIEEIRAAGYGAIWQGQKSWNGVAILARGTDPVEVRRGLPGGEGGDNPDTQSRYLEAAVEGVLVACLYLPNGNPQPGPKFDYKLAWFERLISHAQTLHDSGHPVVIAGDFNVVPTDDDIYNTRSWLKDALLQPESRECYRRLLAQGWVDALRKQYPDERIYTFWDYFRQHWQTNSGLRIDHLLLGPGVQLRDAGVDRWVRGEEKASDHAPTWVVVETGAGGPKKKAPAAKKAAAGKVPVKKAPVKKAPVKKSAPKKTAGKHPASEKTGTSTARAGRRTSGT